MQTPSKKVIYFFIVVVTVVTGIISYNAYQNNKPQDIVAAEEAPKNLAIVVENNYNNSDSDGDGLLDWEEALWNTNASVADSDKDGTDDGAEVALSRDPNKAGLNDAWNPNSYLEEYVSDITIDENSLTSRVARNLLIAVGQGDNPNIAADLLAQIQREVNVADVYKKENLIVFAATDTEKMQAYADNFITIYNQETAKVAFISPTDQESIVTIYKSMALKLSTIAVPADVAQIHVNFVNNLVKMGIFTSVVVSAEKDPIKMVSVLPEFNKIVDEQGVLLEQIKNYLETNGIILKNNV